MGAALIAAVALGHYRTLEEGSRDWVGPWLDDLEPADQDLRAIYAPRRAGAASCRLTACAGA